MRLHDIAPRLARARDQLLREWAERDAACRFYRDWLYEMRRVEAHRELQLQRAQALGSRARGFPGDYIALRHRKLKRARQTREAIESKLRGLAA